MKITIRVVPVEDFSVSQKEAIHALEKECFGDVSQVSKEEDFIAESLAKIFAYNGNSIVGMLSLKKREVIFAGKHVLVGGTGGVCVTESIR